MNNKFLVQDLLPVVALFAAGVSYVAIYLCARLSHSLVHYSNVITGHSVDAARDQSVLEYLFWPLCKLEILMHYGSDLI